MAAFATTSKVLMNCKKKRCRGKNNSGIVTDAALLLCRNVINNLGRCDACVVAGGAIVGVYAQVGKGYARKAGKVVGIVTRRAIQSCR
jgi:predicted Rossmann-fold nucleotide-binding protein